MESDAVDNLCGGNLQDEAPALNSTILNYYKKFGRKRDLEQYFSLSTAQGEVKDPSSLFWRRMKAQNDSSDSGEKSRESSLEVCRISIKCSVPDRDPSSSQDENPKVKSDTESPPIIVEEVLETPKHSDNESVKSDDYYSQKSMDANLDTSMNKVLSPTSSVTSQRKLEWDSLADVGYTYESDKKTSGSSLSTLERLALKQQYSNNDTKEDLGAPTAHSTPVDENEPKPKGKKGPKTTKIYRKDVDFLQVNMPHGSKNPSPSINVNLTKHISFNVEKDGAVSVDNVKKDVFVTPEKVVESTEAIQARSDKEIQTSLVKTKDKSVSSTEALPTIPLYNQGIPVLINLNTLRKRHRRRKLKNVKRRLKSQKKTEDKENLPALEKTGEVSEAESFEYMPGHMYNQKQLDNEAGKASTSGNKSSLTAGNKSSLESSVPTTDSSKGSRHSFTKDLERSIKMLQAALHKRYNDSELKEKLIKEVVQRLIKSNYRDDETTTEFLSGLSFSSKALGVEGNTTTSTSDANNTAEKASRPKKSILRVDKFNPHNIASTSQSVPNLPTVSNSENPVSSKLPKNLSSHTESDSSGKIKTSSDTAFAKTSSEELYQKYLDALRREEAYKKHLRDKEMFLKQKLVCSDSAFNLPPRIDCKSQLRLKELMKDLTRNNYDDGSGDASKLEGGLASSLDLRNQGRSQRSHSVFTLSSSQNSEQNRRNAKKTEVKDSAKPGTSKEDNHYCCCPHHYANKLGVSDSSVQVNLHGGDVKDQQKPLCACKINKNVKELRELKDVQKPQCSCSKNTKDSTKPLRIVADDSGDLKYVCLCKNKTPQEILETTDNVLVYKCSRLTSKGIQSRRDDSPDSSKRGLRDDDEMSRVSKCSQTNVRINFTSHVTGKNKICIHEAIRSTQTDISINPRISEPVLSDIKIINKCDCVQLIREQFRQVSKSSIDTEEKQDAQIDLSSDSDGATVSTAQSKKKRDKQTSTQTVDAGIQSDRDQPSDGANKISGNYTIPIQGTNMTLKVSVGSDMLPTSTAVNDTLNTPEATIFQKEEYPKGIQPQNNAFFGQVGGPQAVNTIFTSGKGSTLQSQSAGNPQKPFVRANTHTGIIAQGSGVSNELIDQYYARQRKNNTEDSQRQEQINQQRKETYNEEQNQRNVNNFDNERQRYGEEREGIDSNRYNLPDAKVQPRPEGQNTEFRKPENNGAQFQNDSFHEQSKSVRNKKSEYEDEFHERRRNDLEEEQSQKAGKNYESNTYPQYGELIAESRRGTASIRFHSLDSQIPPCTCGNACADIAECRQIERGRGACGPDGEPEFDNYSRQGQPYSISKPPFGHDFVQGSMPDSGRYGTDRHESDPRRRDDVGIEQYERIEETNFQELREHETEESGVTHRNNNRGAFQDAPVQYYRDLDLNEVNDPRQDYDEESVYQRRDEQSEDKKTEFKSQKTGIRFDADYSPRMSAKRKSLPPMAFREFENLRKNRSGYAGSDFEEEQAIYQTDLEEQEEPLQQKADYRRSGGTNTRDNDHAGEGEYSQHASGSQSPNRVSRSPRKTGFQDYGDQDGQHSPRYQDIDRGRRPYSSGGEPKDHERQSVSSPRASGFSNQPKSLSPGSSHSRNQRRAPSPGRAQFDRPISSGRSDYGCQRRQSSPGRTAFDNYRRPNSPGPADYRNERRSSSPGYRDARQSPLVVTRKPIDYPSPRPSRARPSCDPTTSVDAPKYKANADSNPRPICDPPKSRSRSPSPSDINADCYSKRPSSPYHQSCIPEESRESYQCRPKQPKCSCPPSSKCEGKCGPSPPQEAKQPSCNKAAESCCSCELNTRCPQCQKAKSSYKDLIMSVISEITDKYSKKDVAKTQKKKAFKEIVSLMKYLLDTEDGTDTDASKALVPSPTESSSSYDENMKKIKTSSWEHMRTQTMTIGDPSFGTHGFNPESTNLVLSTITEQASSHKESTKRVKSVASGTETITEKQEASFHSEKKYVDRGVQGSEDGKSVKPTAKSTKAVKATESSDFAQTTEMPNTSSDSATCKVLNRIRKECEKYQRRCKGHHQSSKKCDCNQSSSSLSCDQCTRVYHCSCRSQKCKGHKSKGCHEKVKKKCIAYNLIIQTSDSMINEEPKPQAPARTLKNIIVKVPPKKNIDNRRPKEMFDACVPNTRFEPKSQRSRSLPNECYMSSNDEGGKSTVFTVRDYLEKNRPDFCEQYSKRQNCLKLINECRSNEREAQRQLLSMQAAEVDGAPLTRLSAADLRRLAKRLGLNLKVKKEPPKLISERDMKKHSEQIYRSLPEQQKKKEMQRQENIKKTNLLMASLFKKNLQKKALRGSVNLSNYNKVITL